MATLLAEASPTKTFFLEMFTRDLSLEECILDLIDNSIDALIRTRKIDVSDAILSPNNLNPQHGSNHIPKIDIKIDETQFRIKDNCGGISIQDATNEVFRFGHTSPTSGTTLGVYGIGLKRAIFKIGNKIYIQSKTADNGFRTKLDVKKWANEESNWKIPLTPIDAAQSAGEQGTLIKIKNLHSEILMRIESGTLLRELKEQIAETYSLFIDRYVIITLNNIRINPHHIPLGESEQVHAAVDSFEKYYDGQKVKVTLISSLAARSQNKTWTAESAGWYALCNGRVVVSADKTDLTGWGTTLLPQYHSKYMGFIGIAFFHSENPHLLPWTTTKQGLNKESQVYQEARNRMAGVARPVLNFLNKMYPSDPAPQTDARKIAEGVTQADIRKVASSTDKHFEIRPTQVQPIKTTISVQYDINESDLERARKCLKKRNMSARKIGEYTFKYFLKMECPE